MIDGMWMRCSDAVVRVVPQRLRRNQLYSKLSNSFKLKGVYPLITE